MEKRQKVNQSKKGMIFSLFNRFKLWFYRNDSKIIITIVLVVSFYVAIKSTNNYYKNEAENKNVVENITTEENNTTENETM